MAYSPIFSGARQPPWMSFSPNSLIVLRPRRGGPSLLSRRILYGKNYAGRTPDAQKWLIFAARSKRCFGHLGTALGPALVLLLLHPPVGPPWTRLGPWRWDGLQSVPSRS